MTSVLIVDDLAIVREPIAAALSQRGYQVRCASNGIEAINMIRAHPPSVILLDLTMPGADGFDVVTNMRADPAVPRIPVIVLTDSNDRETVLRSRQLGIAGYLLKSAFSMERTVLAIERAIRQESRTPRVGVASREAGSADQGACAKPAASKPLTCQQVLKSRKPLLTRSALVERINEFAELKSFPPMVTEVVKLSKSSTASIETMAHLIRRDQSLALKLLKLANSAAYARGRPADSIDKAVMRIGVQGTGQAALSMGIVDQFAGAAGDSSSSLVDLRAFWEHSIACGLIAGRLAEGAEGVASETAFTSGLLHDIGRLALVETAPEEYAQVSDAARELGLPLELVEARLLSMDHAECICPILRAWGLPSELTEPIARHHGAGRMGAGSHANHVRVLTLADRLAHALLVGSSGNDTIYPVENLCRDLKVGPGVLSEIAETIQDATDDLKLGMISAGLDGEWPNSVETIRDRLPGPVRPLYVSAQPEIDACRLFCGRLAAEETGDPPNLTILHIASAGEQASIAKACAAAEAGTRPPMLILSPGGTLAPPAEVAGNRPVASLATPFTVDRFVQEVTRLLAA